MDKMDTLGDRMKSYEHVEAFRKLDPELPIMIRLDGRAFHSFTKGLVRPFDSRLYECMKETTKYVMEECSADLAYTQSDEITLIVLPRNDPYFSGRIQKLCSISASAATVMFNNKVKELLPEQYFQKMPIFDSRVWNVPNLTEATNSVLWRELDAEKNSVAVMAQTEFSHKSLQYKNGKEMKEMLNAIGKSWDDLPVYFKRGTYIKKITIVKKFTTDELDQLPLKHDARINPDLEYKRSMIKEVVFPRLIEVDDKVSLLFN